MNTVHEIDVTELEQVEGGFLPLIAGAFVVGYLAGCEIGHLLFD